MRGNGSRDQFFNLFHRITQAPCYNEAMFSPQRQDPARVHETRFNRKGRFMGVSSDCSIVCAFIHGNSATTIITGDMLVLEVFHGAKWTDCKSMLVDSKTLQAPSRHSRKLSRPSQLEMWGMQQRYEYQPQFPAA